MAKIVNNNAKLTPKDVATRVHHASFILTVTQGVPRIEHKTRGGWEVTGGRTVTLARHYLESNDLQAARDEARVITKMYEQVHAPLFFMLTYNEML